MPGCGHAGDGKNVHHVRQIDVDVQLDRLQAVKAHL
jgi:hypothetical protein